MRAPVVNVGIMTQKAISFTIDGEYVQLDNNSFLRGDQHAICIDGKIVFNGHIYDELYFEPASSTSSFYLKSVTIGIDFHWQRQEDQHFKGTIHLLASHEGIVFINQIDVESYLESVISSEMSAQAPLEFLKAHAVISRSWLLSRLERRIKPEVKTAVEAQIQTEEELIRWYDQEEHQLFDVCADDHCQRYQGISRQTSPEVSLAVNETCGEVLTDGQNICDARFSKCCGGVSEEFENCWAPTHRTYLEPIRDDVNHDVPDLTDEAEAEKWIRSTPPSFCDTSDAEILKQVLNKYDQETKNFYRWKISYSQVLLAELIARKTGIDFGKIIDLKPLQRGASGRIVRLQIVGTKRTFVIGKELEIRRSLSETHLYSSAFVVDKEDIENDIPQRFILTGAGWGHGVGLCQIGAAVMGAKNYDYKTILMHYFKGVSIEKRY